MTMVYDDLGIEQPHLLGHLHGIDRAMSSFWGTKSWMSTVPSPAHSASGLDHVALAVGEGFGEAGVAAILGIQFVDEDDLLGAAEGASADGVTGLL